MDIYVGNLPYDAEESGIQELFAAFGEVKRVKIITDHETGRSRGFGFISMSDEVDAETVVLALDGTKFNGRNLRVKIAEQRQNKNRRDGRDRESAQASNQEHTNTRQKRTNFREGDLKRDRKGRLKGKKKHVSEDSWDDNEGGSGRKSFRGGERNKGGRKQNWHNNIDEDW